MEGQITLFEVFKPTEDIRWAEEITNGLKNHCTYWKYDWINKLLVNKSPEHFWRLFCGITKTYYMPINEEHYRIEFGKDGNVAVKRIGSDWAKRGEDAIIRIEEILEQL